MNKWINTNKIKRPKIKQHTLFFRLVLLICMLVLEKKERKLTKLNWSHDIRNNPYKQTKQYLENNFRLVQLICFIFHYCKIYLIIATFISKCDFISYNCKYITCNCDCISHNVTFFKINLTRLIFHLWGFTLMIHIHLCLSAAAFVKIYKHIRHKIYYES